MKRTIITYIILFLVCTTSCVRYDIDEILLQKEEISFTSKGVVQMKYDPQTCQMSHNASRNEFRVYKDDISDWFMVTCSQKPSEEGQTIKANVAWTANTTNHTINGLDFEVKRISVDGRIWMWCQSAKIGVVLQELL